MPQKRLCDFVCNFVMRNDILSADVSITLISLILSEVVI